MNSITVQLYGGGIDSLCIAHAIKPDVKVYFDLGTEESYFESLAAARAGCIIDRRLALGDQVLPNKILPLRNMLLVGMAAYYGNDIILGSTLGDTTRDKDEQFLSLSSSLLRHILMHDPDKSLPFHANGVTVRAPAIHSTKAELVREYLETGGSMEELLMSRSCYSDSAMECGECRSCVRKAVAFRLNGLQYSFKKSPDFEEALNYARTRGRNIREIADIEQAITMGGSVL